MPLLQMPLLQMVLWVKPKYRHLWHEESQQNAGFILDTTIVARSSVGGVDGGLTLTVIGL